MSPRLISLVAFASIVSVSYAPAQEARKLTAEQRNEVIQRVLGELDRGYVFPDIARAMRAGVVKQQSDGRYNTIEDAREFATALTRDLQAISNDKHLRITYSGAQPQTRPAGGPPPALASPIEKVSRLEGNVGYLKINGFPPAQTIGPRITEAMKELGGTEALIIDLRDNRGGAPDGAMYLAGHFFVKRTLVAHIFSRPDSSTTEMWTETVPGPLYLNKKLYILTSRTTFSAGEAAAYHLKHVAKAITVGDTTGGGAHRIRGASVGHDLAVSVPMTRPINVVTKADWEGTGVIPEIPTSAEKALNAAHLAALKALPRNAERDAVIARLERESR